MSGVHFVRTGVLGQIDRYRSADAAEYPRGCRVIVRTPRGLELGTVLAVAAADSPLPREPGLLVRRTTVEDELLAARLDRHRQAALAACADRLAALGLAAPLVDVEHLFDGQTLAFYFLGEPPAALEAVLADLATVYEAKAELRQFADLLTHGCGPDCGTASAAGCGACGTGCSLAAACGTRAAH